jgi:hypothetical protein
MEPAAGDLDEVRDELDRDLARLARQCLHSREQRFIRQPSSSDEHLLMHDLL